MLTRIQLCRDQPVTAPTTPSESRMGRLQQRPSAPATTATGARTAVRSRIGDGRPELVERRCALEPAGCGAAPAGQGDRVAGLGEDVHAVDLDAR